MEEKDLFEKELYRRLYNEEMIPQADMWKRVEDSLNHNSKRRVRVVTLVSKIVASAAVAAAVWVAILLSSDNIDNNSPSASPDSTIPGVSMVAATEIEKVESKMVAENVMPIEERGEMAKVERQREVKVSPAISLDSAINIVATPTKEVEKSIKPIAKEDKYIANYRVKERETKSVKKSSQTTTDNQSQRRFDALVKRGSRDRGVKINLCGGISSTSLTDVSFLAMSSDNMQFSTFDGSLPDEEIYHNASIYSTPEIERQWRHERPITFGVTALKMLNSWFGVESGIAYTLLSSTSLGEGAVSADLKSKYDYIGIPVNVYASIVNSRKVELYGKVGVLVDKCISANTITILDNQSSSESIAVDGIQLSLLAQVGLSYNLFGNISLYVEPTLAYYVKGNQPRSYRTDNQFGFSAFAGVRFNLFGKQ